MPSRRAGLASRRASHAAHRSDPAAAAPTSLAWQAARAAEIGVEVRAGRSLTSALAESAHWRDPRSAVGRAAVHDLVYRTMRRRGTADALLARLVDRPPPAPIRELLVTALALASDEPTPYADHVLVDQCVEAAAQWPSGAPRKAFVNAVLRRYLRERAALHRALVDDEVARWNHPQWWIAAVRRDHPDEWRRILAAGNEPPPLTLRVNARRADRASVLERYRAHGLDAHPMRGFDAAIKLAAPRAVETIPSFGDGEVSVQDAAAQLAAPLLDAADGERVLDACAAPGGKTAHILELARADLVALDQDATRLQRVAQNLARLNLHARLVAADAAEPDAWWDGRPFDRILADVPCTASGIVRRHPDVRWLRRPADREQLATASARILAALWRVLAPGGTIVLATCSIFKQEGELQAQRFLASHPDAERLDAPGQLLPTSTPAAVSVIHDEPDHDGFFYARFAKRRSA